MSKNERDFHIHLVSDATGETLHALARACIAQFDNVRPIEHIWNMVRTERQLSAVIEGLKANPGLVLMTLVNDDVRRKLSSICRDLQLPCVPVLDPVMNCLGNYLGQTSRAQPGRQYILDEQYFDRMEAMDYVLNHDDGMTQNRVQDADIVLVGVSRTSKTPTCVYLGNKGLKAANIPLIPNVTDIQAIKDIHGPLFVALTASPKRLMEIRRNRLRSLNEQHETDYTNPESIEEELAWARRFYKQMKWPVIDVTSRSVEEIVAEILKLYQRHKEDQNAA